VQQILEDSAETLVYASQFSSLRLRFESLRGCGTTIVNEKREMENEKSLRSAPEVRNNPRSVQISSFSLSEKKQQPKG
jgi:hypothetical protein